jgi:hypothetical protein
MEMPTLGLSLVGFMVDPQHVLGHLKTPCIPDPTKSDVDLLADWNTAKAKLGRPIVNAGNPRLQAIPMNDPHIQQLLQVPWAAGYLVPHLAQGASFQMVGIESLLAYQFAIDVARSKSRCGAMSKPPTRDELMNICLPLTHPNDGIHVSGQGLAKHQSIIIKSRSLNLAITAEGPLVIPIPNAPPVQCAYARRLRDVLGEVISDLGGRLAHMITQAKQRVQVVDVMEADCAPQQNREADVRTGS